MAIKEIYRGPDMKGGSKTPDARVFGGNGVRCDASQAEENGAQETPTPGFEQVFPAIALLGGRLVPVGSSVRGAQSSSEWSAYVARETAGKDPKARRSR